MKPKFSGKKRLFLFFAPLALLLLAGAWLVLRDEPPHDDSDLRNYRRAVKDEENGFALLEAILIDVEWPEEWEDQEPVFGHSKNFDRKRAAEIAADNDSVFEELDRCLAMADLQVPPSESLGGSSVDGEGLHRLSYALESRSRLRIEEGKPEEAYEDVMRLVRLGSRLQRAQGPVIDHLLGLGAQGMGIWRLVQLAARAELPPRLLALGARELRSEFHPDALRDALRAEHVALSGDLDQWAAGDTSCCSGVRERSSSPTGRGACLPSGSGASLQSAKLPSSSESSSPCPTRVGRRCTCSGAPARRR